MKGFRKFIVANVLILVIFLAIQIPASAGLSMGIGFGGRGHHGGFSFSGYFPLTDNYFVRDPYYTYYPSVPYNYYIAQPPAGVVVYAIPAGCRQIVMNGTTYYEYNGTYYLPVAGGYQIVLPPVPAQPVITTLAADIGVGYVDAQGVQQMFTVNVPDTHGGYTTVIIKRSGTGFVGPQGEFYNEFPAIQQLRVMYTH